MPIQTCVVDNRVFLLGLDELYRGRMKAHERGELLRAARGVCHALDVVPQSGPVEGYYAEDALLTEYFRHMRALQKAPETLRARAGTLPEFRRLLDVASAPLYGKPTFDGKLLPAGMDPFSRALEATFPNWTVGELTSVAFSRALDSDDFSLVGLAALAKDAVVLAALRETAVLYAEAVLGCVPGSVAKKYEWRVDPIVAERASHFVATFNELFDESLPAPTPDHAEVYWDAADEGKIYGRCVRLGCDSPIPPVRHYHWAVAPGSRGLEVRDFWSTELWTTERFRETLSKPQETPVRPNAPPASGPKIRLELLYPSRRREFRTRLSPAEAARALAEEVEPSRWPVFRWGSKTFQGTVSESAFDIERVISYRNSFLPKVRGTIRADAQGSSISVSMSLSPFVLVLLAVWLCAAVPMFMSLPAGDFKFIPVAMPAFIWTVTISGFHFEAAKAERALLRIFRATVWRPELASPGSK